MAEPDILNWLQQSALGDLMRNVPWLFGTFEALHFMGLSLLMGAMLIVDLRLMGLMRRIPLGAALKFTHLAAIGLAINAVTGVGFVAFDAMLYWTNPAFKLKLALIILALLNILWFEFATRPRALALGDAADTDARMKVIGALSLTLWITILILGRLLPTFEVPPEIIF